MLHLTDTDTTAGDAQPLAQGVEVQVAAVVFASFT